MRNFNLKKLYYSISEVSKIVGLEQYTLRYWEREFEQLKPSKNRSENRIYTNKDIKLIMKIKNLLRDEKYTIEGAKKILEKSTNNNTTKISKSNTNKKNITSEKSLKNDLEEIKKFLLDLNSKL